VNKENREDLVRDLQTDSPWGGHKKYLISASLNCLMGRKLLKRARQSQKKFRKSAARSSEVIISRIRGRGMGEGDGWRQKKQ